MPESFKTSEKLIKQQKIQKFTEIFENVDVDQDGVIDSKTADFSTLPEEIFVCLTPLIAEMDEIQQDLTKEEFIDACMRLYPTLNINQKNQILAYKRVQKSSFNTSLQSCTF